MSCDVRAHCLAPVPQREELSVAEADIQLNNYLSTVSTRQLARVYLTAPRGSLVSPLATDDAVNEHTVSECL